MLAEPPPSARLRFPRVAIDEALALVQETVRLPWRTAPGYPDDGTRHFALRTLVSGADEAEPCGMYHVIERETGLLMGHVGLKGAPTEDGAVEVGYAIAAPSRGRGYAGDALAAIVQLAATHPGVRVVRADTTVDNLASRRVLERGGFRLTGDDGVTRWYALSVPDAPSSRAL